ncbi:MAG: dihydrolipoamide acetyltransferase family protein, partial [Acidimicrobiia bacterium]
MPTTVTMPQLGETVTEGTILRWAKNVGDPIATDEVLVEISTDKVDTEIPSPAQGVVIELLVGEGETVAVGTALAVIGEAGEAPGADGQAPAEAPTAEAPPAEAPPAKAPAQEPAAPAPPPVQEAPQQEAPKQEAPAAVQAPPREVSVTVEPSPPEASDDAPNRGVLSPVVRKLARDQGIDLGTLTGSGEGGRITRRDVEAAIASQDQPAATAPAPTAPTAEPAPVPVAAPPTRPAPSSPPPMAPPAPAVASGAEEVSLDRLRVRIGENMLRAKQTAAHVWTSVEVDYERVERVRSAAKESWKKEEGFSLTYLPFIARATIDALKEYPVVNSSFFLEERKSILHRTVNLGVAIDLDQKGLVVATIRNADGLRLVGLARRIRELAEKARAGKLDPDDVSGSTFSITNPGPYG